MSFRKGLIGIIIIGIVIAGAMYLHSHPDTKLEDKIPEVAEQAYENRGKFFEKGQEINQKFTDAVADFMSKLGLSQELAMPSDSTTNKKPKISLLTMIGMEQESGHRPEIPAYTGSPYAKVNGNKPYFKEDEITTKPFESYSPLDAMGRCGTATACIGIASFPEKERGDISEIHPSGWAQEKYDFIDEEWLYNRCHLIAYCVGGDDKDTNLITGTKYLNTEGMWPIESEVYYYIKDNPNNHVMYRVTPIFDGANLLCSGVLMEGYSVEDEGKGVNFCVYCYNVQPNVSIDYTTGESFPNEEEETGGTE